MSRTPAFMAWVPPASSVRTWDQLAAWHDGRCALCGVKFRALAVDHDHATGLVRGVLCMTCNVYADRDTEWRGGGNPCTWFGVAMLYRPGLGATLPKALVTYAGLTRADECAVCLRARRAAPAMHVYLNPDGRSRRG